MVKKLRKPLLFTVALLPLAVIGGVFSCMYSFDTYAPEMREQLLARFGSYGASITAGALQSVIFVVVCGFFGYILAEKIGLMKRFNFDKATLLKVAIITIVCGILFSLDYWVFGKVLPQVAELYETKITFNNFMASVFYGGIAEEVLMRLFLMSLFAFVLWKLFYRKFDKEEIPIVIFIVANILTAVLYGIQYAMLGHMGCHIVSKIIWLLCI